MEIDIANINLENDEFFLILGHVKFKRKDFSGISMVDEGEQMYRLVIDVTNKDNEPKTRAILMRLSENHIKLLGVFLNLE